MEISSPTWLFEFVPMISVVHMGGAQHTHRVCEALHGIREPMKSPEVLGGKWQEEEGAKIFLTLSLSEVSPMQSFSLPVLQPQFQLPAATFHYVFFKTTIEKNHTFVCHIWFDARSTSGSKTDLKQNFTRAITSQHI